MRTGQHTLRALSAPRRALPTLFVVLALLVSEAAYTGRVSAVAIDLGLCFSFWLVAPAAWRRLCGDTASLETGPVILSYAAYLGVCAALVTFFGLALPAGFDAPPTYMTEPPALALTLVMFAVGGWGLGRDIELEAGLFAERQRAERLAREAGHAQLLALRAQLDPHFLFNTLNAIAEWCREDPAVAEAATLRLAALLRAILDGVREPTWPLARELQILRDLFELYEVRDAERYRLALDLPDPLPDVEVPPLVLLPIFENAITHGPSAGHSGVVRLALSVSPEGVRFELRNPGAFTGRRAGGEGIAMVERRLVLAYEDSASLQLQADGEHTITTVSLPLRPLASELGA